MAEFETFRRCWLATLSSRNHLVSRFWVPTTAVRCTRRSRGNTHDSQNSPKSTNAYMHVDDSFKHPALRARSESCPIVFRTLTHPVKSVTQFRGLWLLVRSCSCPQVKCKRSVGGCLSSHFAPSEIRPISTTAAPQSRGVGLR